MCHARAGYGTWIMLQLRLALLQEHPDITYTKLPQTWSKARASSRRRFARPWKHLSCRADGQVVGISARRDDGPPLLDPALYECVICVRETEMRQRGA